MLGYYGIAETNVHRTVLGVPNLLVLTVTTNEMHMRTIMELLREITSAKGSKVFLFKTLPTLGDFHAAPAPTPHL
jgi:hypothetical protein